MNVFLSLLAAIGVAAGSQPLSQSQVFGDHMVLQCEKPVAVWGQGQAGTQVAVSFNGQEKSCTVDCNGQWRLDLDPMPVVREGQTMTVKSSAGETLTYSDVLVGEVWLCSGQSNMEMGISECENGAAEVEAANDPMIRIFEPAVSARYLEATDLSAAWARCSTEAVKKGAFGGFGAIAYFFARDIRAKRDVPVGVINSCWGGTPIRAYIPEEVFDRYPSLKGNAVDFRKVRDEYLDKFKRYFNSSKDWIAEAKKKLAGGHNELSWAPTMPENPEPDQPCVIYNAMIAPLVPYTLRGMLWYQGEFEVIERACGKAYYEKMHALVEGWRSLWNDEVPFYYVQIAPWAYKGLYDYRMNIVDAQTRALDIPGTGLALTYDLTDDLGNIHPKKKQPLARRLANLALAEVYGEKGLEPYSPFMEKVVLGVSDAKVYFSNAYSGLKTSDGKDPDMFELAGPDGKFVPAVAEITGKNEITLTSAELNEIKYVQFARDYIAQPNLRNGADLPASTFTTYDAREKSLAYQQPVEGGSYLDCTPDYLTDGRTDRGNGWQSDVVNAGEATVCLAEPAQADTVVVYPFSDGRDWQRFAVSVCDENGNWEEVGKKDDTRPTPDKVVYRFSERPVSKIRLQVLQTLNWQRARFNEIQLFDGYEE